jgi:hypothetical protein
MFIIAQRNKGRNDIALRRDFLCRTEKTRNGSPLGFFSKVDIAPAHCLAYPIAENLRNGFVAGEARSQMASAQKRRPILAQNQD